MSLQDELQRLKDQLKEKGFIFDNAGNAIAILEMPNEEERAIIAQYNRVRVEIMKEEENAAR